MAKSEPVASAEMIRTTSFRSEGTRTSTPAAASGMTMRASSACPCSTLTSDREPHDGDHDYAQDHGQGVVRQLTGLLELEQEPEPARHLGGAVHARVVHHGAVEEGDDLRQAKDQVVDGPLVEVIHVELVPEQAVNEGEAGRRRLRQRGVPSPYVDAATKPGADEQRRDDRHGPVEGEPVRLRLKHVLDETREAGAEAERAANAFNDDE